jgi:ankyrin repeat protein
MCLRITANKNDKLLLTFPFSSHKRSKSSALSLIRGKKGKEENNNSEEGSLVSQPSTAQSGAPLAMAHNPRGHLQRQSTGTAGLMRSPSNTLPSTKSASAQGLPSQEKPISIEQSVRKFRIFEALRNGDTALISKTIRETDNTRTSISSINSPAATGGLDDTSILHLAIQCAELPVVEYVLSDGAGTIDINARDKDGNTALHLAASQGRGHIVRTLLDQPGINDSIPNHQGRLPLDLARTPDIFQQLQLSRSIFVDSQIKEVQGLVARGEYKKLSEVLDEPRLKTVLDINGGEFASDMTTIQSGGTLLHEAARKRNIELIKVLLLNGADPFRRDRRGKLPQDVTKDDATRAMLKRSPAAMAAQRGIQEKAVLGNALQQGAANPGSHDPLAGKEGREMKGYLKKWTNYRKGYQLRWFVLEDGVMSYYKHQDDSGSACRGAINMRIAKLNMDPTEKTKFDILGKSSVKYHLKANHEVEAKRWFWALNNSIQWTKDQAKEEDRQNQRSAERLRQAKADHSGSSTKDPSATEPGSETGSVVEIRRNSSQATRLLPQTIPGKSKVGFASAGSLGDDDETTNYGSYEPSFAGDVTRIPSNINAATDIDEDEEYGEGSSDREAPANKDAFDITAQSAKMQLEFLSHVNAALQAEQSKNPDLPISDSVAVQAVQTYDSSIRNLQGLVGDLLKITKDRDAYWQYKLDQEADMRRIWEESMAQVAREQEVLEARVGESEEKRKLTKRTLREVIDGSITISSKPGSRGEPSDGQNLSEALEQITIASDGTASRRKSTVASSLRRKTLLLDVSNLSESESEDDDEFFDAVDAGEVVVAPMMPTSPVAKKTISETKVKGVDLIDITSSFKGYETGIRKRLAMDADDRPKISLWVSLPLTLAKAPLIYCRAFSSL